MSELIKYNHLVFTPIKNAECLNRGNINISQRKKRFLPLSGFTLIEITISLLILAIGLIGILTLFPVGFDAAGRASNVMVATFLAQGKIEEAKRVGYENVDTLDTGGSKADFDPPYTNFQYEIVVTSGVKGLDLKQVDVTVYWPPNVLLQRNITLTTYMAQYEVE